MNYDEIYSIMMGTGLILVLVIGFGSILIRKDGGER